MTSVSHSNPGYFNLWNFQTPVQMKETRKRAPPPAIKIEIENAAFQYEDA